MATLQELMGREIYDLLYTHYDKNGYLIEDIDDVLYCEDNDIPQDRISKLETLLTPITDAKSSLIPIESAKFLAAWGYEKAIDYFQYCVDNRIDNLGNLEPHRLHGYDVTYENFISSLLHYYARKFDQSIEEGEKARYKIFPVMEKIIGLTKELTIDINALTKEIKEEDWKEYLPAIKECYLDLIRRSEDDFNRLFNLEPVKALLLEWEPNFLKA